MTDSAAGTVSEHETSSGRVTVRSTHPCGNGRALDIADDAILLEPETRDSTREWFYWNVRIDSSVAQVLTVAFPGGEFVGPHGPAVRTVRRSEPSVARHEDDRSDVGSVDADHGPAWCWLGPEARIDAGSFRYAFDAGERAEFALSFPYGRADFERFRGTVASDPRAGVEHPALDTGVLGEAA